MTRRVHWQELGGSGLGSKLKGAVTDLVKLGNAPHSHPPESRAQRRNDRHQYTDDHPNDQVSLAQFSVFCFSEQLPFQTSKTLLLMQGFESGRGFSERVQQIFTHTPHFCRHQEAVWFRHRSILCWARLAGRRLSLLFRFRTCRARQCT